jgi:hypothetical protein
MSANLSRRRFLQAAAGVAASATTAWGKARHVAIVAD